MQLIDGGICAAKGFSANGIHCGIRKNKIKRDLALIVSEEICRVGVVYTQNKVKGAPILVSQENLANGLAKALICNSGNANTCNANGVDTAREMCALVQKYTKVSATDVIVASTGVIGQPLDISPIKNGMKELVAGLGNNSKEANQAIMTTDLVEKSVAMSFNLGGKECRIGGIAKGSGMIHPNMATMLAFFTTDVNISRKLLQKAVKEISDSTFNMVSVDGDTSTNDMFVVMANGLAGNSKITQEGADFNLFKEALKKLATIISKKLAADGEGATKLLECAVTNGKSLVIAKKVAKAIIMSPLVKTACFGADANWGRILCAVGYSKTDIDVSKVDISFASDAGLIDVCKNGSGIPFDEIKAKEILSEKEIQILVNLNDGFSSACAWGCDLTYEYVKINGDYRT